MGKRKSKTSKQKQAKASAKSLKARVIKEQPPRKERNNPFGNSSKPRKPKSSSNNLSEQDEFQRQQASMKERLMATTQREKQVKDRQRKQQRGRQQQQKEGQNQQPIVPSAFAFAAPTLLVDDNMKSTTQLMTEVTSKAQGWQGIGVESHNASGMVQHQDPQPPQHKPISLQQVYQSASHQQQMQQISRGPQISKSKNPFAALEHDDSDDEEQARAPPTLFQGFAPASFSISKTPITGSSTTNAQQEMDPDL